MQELKEKIARSGQTLKAIAAAVDCTPQHLSAVLCGRAKLTKRLRARLEDTLKEIKCTWPVEITLHYRAAEWQTLKMSFPPDIDIEQTLKDYLWWLSYRFYMQQLPPEQRARHIAEEKADGVNACESPLRIIRKGAPPLYIEAPPFNFDNSTQE